MSQLKQTLEAAQIRSALIIDDAYELKPLAKDLSQDEEKWGQFFEDLDASDRALLTELFPLFPDLRADDLRASDEFVEAVWNGQAKIRGEIVEPLFERYKADKNGDLAYLATLAKCLQECEIEYKTSSKAFQSAASDADLIIVDLFLGSAQDDEAIENSVVGLKEVVRTRQPNPPLVILMSRSSRLESKREEFRDRSGLFESAFRIVRKSELAEEGKLARILMRLAEHSADSRRLSQFLHAWQSGLSIACERTTHLIRTLDLSDHAQIRQLLLKDEEESPGSHLVDVFEYVLQHEIEREAAIIDAANALSGLDAFKYPPPYLTGSPDLQALVFRCLFQNRERLRLNNPQGNRVLFGDILRRKAVHSKSGQCETQDPTKGWLLDFGPLDVLIVLTPACDLQRVSAKRFLLLKGSLIPLGSTNWLHEDRLAQTAIFQTSSGERFQIKWDLKHLETIHPLRLAEMLEDPLGLEVVARLRQPYALELQQKLLSNLGRVGLVAAMPGTFAVAVEAYFPGPDGLLFKSSIPALDNNAGVCFVGRKDDEPATTLVLCEDACEAICGTIQSLALETIHPSTVAIIRDLRTSGQLLCIERGIDVSGVKESRFTEIKGHGNSTIALVRKWGQWVREPLKNNVLRQAGVVLVLKYDDCAPLDIGDSPESKAASPEPIETFGQ